MIYIHCILLRFVLIEEKLSTYYIYAYIYVYVYTLTELCKKDIYPIYHRRQYHVSALDILKYFL
jgi:hypothetical protein